MTQFTLTLEGEAPITGNLELETSIPTVRYRIAWDDETPRFNYKSRTQAEGWLGLKSPPAVYRYYPVMKDGAGDFRVDISDWWDQCVALNGGDVRDVEYWSNRQSGQFNRTGWPKFANVGMSGNYLKVLDISNGWVKFETLKPTDLQKAKTMTRLNNPEFVHTFTCVSWDTELKKTKHIVGTNTARGIVDYYLITKEGYAYIREYDVVRETL